MLTKSAYKKTHTFTVLTSCFFVQTNQNHEHFFVFVCVILCVQISLWQVTNKQKTLLLHTHKTRWGWKRVKEETDLRCKRGRNACKTRQICQNILCQVLSSLNNMCNVWMLLHYFGNNVTNEMKANEQDLKKKN